ncbi:hypothetical protein LJC33_06785 [Eubacteriales bacterium OttesenSCG-928-N13]|nr:hypothetical protein [Eubacteriales bacterium OttesenSCG-928-N13]
MKRLLKSPMVNAVCISIFSAFYACIFIISSGYEGFISTLYYGDGVPFWSWWGRFLAAGHQMYIAWALIAVTILIVILLTAHRRPHDEYFTSMLTSCLVVASILTLVAIAVFYVMILSNPVGIVEKFTLFITIHWATVVLANLTYVFLCRRR